MILQVCCKANSAPLRNAIGGGTWSLIPGLGGLELDNVHVHQGQDSKTYIVCSLRRYAATK